MTFTASVGFHVTVTEVAPHNTKRVTDLYAGIGHFYNRHISHRVFSLTGRMIQSQRTTGMIDR
jgi:hypothetical protein